MELIIKEAEQLPAQIETLLKLANKEGVNVVQRLIDEYASGQNRFQDKGEFFLIAYDGDKLIGCGGLNQQREEEGQKSRIGRVRRFYVHPKYLLVAHCNFRHLLAINRLRSTIQSTHRLNSMP